MKIDAITKENLPRCRELILPYIYEELDAFETRIYIREDGDPKAP